MSLLILYGSETGTAQDTAESLRREALLRHIETRVYGLDEYDITNLPRENVVLFIVSTTGQGEMPPNMRTSWKLLLRKSLGNDFLQNTYAAVLGLGDSSYQKYNFAGKKMYRRLKMLGAKMIADLGLADDQHEIGIDGAFIPWKDSVWTSLHDLKIFPDMTLTRDDSIKIKPKYIFSQPTSVETQDQDHYPLIVSFNKRVTAEDHFQDTRLVRFDIPEHLNHHFNYVPGDVLMVKPYNPEETMKIALEALDYSDEILDSPRTVIKNNEFSRNFPYYLVGEQTTIRQCLRRYFDLQQIPKRSFFEVLSSLATNEMEKERLMELTSPEGLDDLLMYTTRYRRTIAEALRDFPATVRHLPPDQLFELLPVIRARAFSIASAPNPNYIELIVAKVEYKSRMADKRRGLCSTFISRLEPNDKVLCKVRTGTFKFPPPERPVICVGPGTGVAPFRSFLVDRNNRTSVRNSVLFFGCRGKQLDNYFGDEWPSLANVEVISAFSRDMEKKDYVQHRILLNKKKVLDVLANGGYVFIAGSSGDMPKAVTSALDEVAKDDARFENGWVEMAEKTNNIQYETWS